MRFLVFAGQDYYPRGGWNDFRGCCDTLKQATALAESEIAVGNESKSLSTRCRKHQEPITNISSAQDWAQVVDTKTLTVIELAAPKGYCSLCETKPEYPQWSEVSPGTDPGNSGTDPLTKEQTNV